MHQNKKQANSLNTKNIKQHTINTGLVYTYLKTQQKKTYAYL